MTQKILNIDFISHWVDIAKINFSKNKTENRPAINGSYLKENIKQVKLESVFMARTDYNDLGDSFQKIFKKVADKKLNLKNQI